MQSMLKLKPTDDPHDILVVAPDAVRVAPFDDAPPAQDAARPASDPLIPAGSILSAGAAVPPVDTTFRPTAVDDMLMSGGRRSIGQRALRAVAALLLAACIGGAAIAWHSHGDAAQQMIAEWAPLFAQKSSQPSEKTGLPAQPALAAAEVDAASATRPAAQAPAAAKGAAPVAPDEAPSLETMARDLANAGQEIEALKASIEQLKASQQQLVAMVSEKNAAQALRPKKPAQPRPVAALAPAHKPPPLLPPRQTVAAPPSQTAAEPTSADPEQASVPRPPMPLR